MSTAEREPWRQSSVTTASDESALMEKVAGIVSRTMSDHYGDKLTFEVGVERHFESWDNGDVDPYLYVEIVFSGDEQYIMKEISKKRRPLVANHDRSLVPVPSYLRDLYQLITLLLSDRGWPGSQTSERFPRSTMRPR